MGNFVEIGSLVCRIFSNVFLSHSQHDIMDFCIMDKKYLYIVFVAGQGDRANKRPVYHRSCEWYSRAFVSLRSIRTNLGN